MEMSEIYNGSQWAHDIFLVNKAGAMEYITGRSYPVLLLFFVKCRCRCSLHVRTFIPEKELNEELRSENS